MTAFAFVGTALVFLALGLFGYAWITAPERQRAARRLRNARWLADKYRALYGESVAREAIHLYGPRAAWGPVEALSRDERAWDEELLSGGDLDG